MSPFQGIFLVGGSGQVSTERVQKTYTNTHESIEREGSCCGWEMSDAGIDRNGSASLPVKFTETGSLLMLASYTPSKREIAVRLLPIKVDILCLVCDNQLI